MFHQLVDNTFDDLERPQQLFPRWFDTAGLIYICPQQIAAELTKHDAGATAPAINQHLTAYIDEARAVAAQLVDRSHLEPHATLTTRSSRRVLGGRQRDP